MVLQRVRHDWATELNLGYNSELSECWDFCQQQKKAKTNDFLPGWSSRAGGRRAGQLRGDDFTLSTHRTSRKPSHQLLRAAITPLSTLTGRPCIHLTASGSPYLSLRCFGGLSTCVLPVTVSWCFWTMTHAVIFIKACVCMLSNLSHVLLLRPHGQ